MGTDKEKRGPTEFMAKSRLSFNRDLFFCRFSAVKPTSSFTRPIPIGAVSLFISIRAHPWFNSFGCGSVPRQDFALKSFFCLSRNHATEPMNIDKSQHRIRKMFGEISPRYDFLNHVLSGGTDFYWRWRTVRTVLPNGNDPILDVCCGTGDLAIAYWKKGNRRTQVVGTDFTHEMLELANKKTSNFVTTSSAEQADQAITFLEADTQQLPFADDRFQIVSVGFGLRNVTDTEQGLREMVRVCRPGGFVVVLEFSMPGNRILRGLYRWYFKHILPRIGQLLARNRESAYNYLPQSVSEFSQGEKLAEIMRHCGLESVRWKSLTFGVATLYWGVKPELL
jgi:demethylmenaquinone methyltransferase/2-methoxy-6-polyprenyl-1,4-benzoquinol methylase